MRGHEAHHTFERLGSQRRAGELGVEPLTVTSARRRAIRRTRPDRGQPGGVWKDGRAMDYALHPMWVFVAIASVALLVGAVYLLRRQSVSTVDTAQERLAALEERIAGRAELAPLSELARTGDTRALLSRISSLRGQWDDLAFELMTLGDAIPRRRYDDLLVGNAQPLPHLLRGVHQIGAAWTARGAGSGDEVTDDRGQAFHAALEQALGDLNAATQDAADPTAWAMLIHVHRGLTGDGEAAMAAFHEAISREPAHAFAHRAIVTFLARKWHGEDGTESLGLARERLHALPEGTWAGAEAVVLAHFQEIEYRALFDGKPDEAIAYLRDDPVAAELRQLWDRALAAQAPRPALQNVMSMSAILMRMLGDRERCRAALDKLGPWCDPMQWQLADLVHFDARAAFEATRRWAA
jgi:hypothetical protein